VDYFKKHTASHSAVVVAFEELRNKK